MQTPGEASIRHAIRTVTAAVPLQLSEDPMNQLETQIAVLETMRRATLQRIGNTRSVDGDCPDQSLPDAYPQSTNAVDQALDLALQNLSAEMQETPSSAPSHPSKTREDVLNAFLQHVWITISEERRERNNLLPFHQLPIELFTIILERAVGEFFPYTTPQILRDLSCVSHYWAEAVRYSPYLWATVSSSSPDKLIAACLTRSRPRPLKIIGQGRFDNDVTSLQNFLDKVVPHVDRWASAELQVITRAGVPQLPQGPAPLLEELELYGVPEEVSRRVEIFSGGAPKLRRLTANRVSLHWDSQILSNLEYLEIIPADGRNYPKGASFDEVSNILATCSRLQSLRVGVAWDTARNSGWGAPTTVDHQFLTQLHLSPIPWDSLCHLRYLVRSPLCSDLSLDFQPGEGRMVGEYAVTFVGVMENMVPNTRLQIASAAAIYLTLCLPDLFLLRVHASNGQRTLQVRLYNAGILPLQWLGEALAQVTPGSVEMTLELFLDTATFLTEVLDQLPSITTLQLKEHRGGVAGQILQHLARPSPWALPQLHTLRLRDTEVEWSTLLEMVTSRYGGGDNQAPGDSGPQPLKRLVLGKAKSIEGIDVGELERVLGEGVVDMLSA